MTGHLHMQGRRLVAEFTPLRVDKISVAREPLNWRKVPVLP